MRKEKGREEIKDHFIVGIRCLLFVTIEWNTIKFIVRTKKTSLLLNTILLDDIFMIL